MKTDEQSIKTATQLLKEKEKLELALKIYPTYGSEITLNFSETRKDICFGKVSVPCPFELRNTIKSGIENRIAEIVEKLSKL